MEIPAPPDTPQPGPEESGGSGALRRTAYAALAVMLLGGGWVKFNDRIARISPGLAGPAAAVAQQPPSGTAVKALFELGLISTASAPQAVASMGLPHDQATRLATDLKRDRLRLVQLPLFDAGPAGADQADRAVEVSSGGYSRVVLLTRQPTVVTLPISRVGTVSFRVASAGPVGIGAITLTGPLQMPDLAPGQQLDVGVVAQ